MLIMPNDGRPFAHRRGFTLVEILTVIIIIVILIAIALPVVSKVRKAAQRASVQQQLSSIAAAIERYNADFRAYPGPLSNDQIRPTVVADQPQIFDPGGTTPMVGRERITMAENLVLGLLGGLRSEVATGGPAGSARVIVFDFKTIGQGPGNLNPKQPKKYSPYAEPVQLSWDDGQPSSGTASGPGATTGVYVDDASLSRGSVTGAQDSAIPEFVDRFPSPMPILYLRARPAAKGVISDDVTTAPGVNYQYDLNQIIGYTALSGTESIGVGKEFGAGDYVVGTTVTPPAAGTLPHGLRTVTNAASLQKGDAGYRYPFDALPYFTDPTIRPTDAARPNETGTPRKKNGFILVSAGVDRVYGTYDDITSFGDVAP